MSFVILPGTQTAINTDNVLWIDRDTDTASSITCVGGSSFLIPASLDDVLTYIKTRQLQDLVDEEIAVMTATMNLVDSEGETLH